MALIRMGFIRWHTCCAPLGLNGVDINMGCPSKSVSARGCGAALIKNPPLARTIIRAVQAGVRDWASGHAINTIGLRSQRGRTAPEVD